MAINRYCIIFAGLGGTMPTLCRLASTYATDPGANPPGLGVYIGLLLFFAIGSILAGAFSESDLKKAFIIGVSAPGIITNIASGVSDASSDQAKLYNGIVNTAYAAEVPVPNSLPPAQNSNQPKKITINTYSKGGTNNDMQHNFLVAVKNKNREERIVGMFGEQSYNSNSTNKNNNFFNLPIGTTEIVIYAKGFTKVISVPNKEFSTATIALIFYVQTKNDFLWSIGAKRGFEVANIDAYFTSFE